MAEKKVGVLIREARNAAGLTQAQLAKKIDGLSAADISKAERGEKELSQTQLKAIAKATGVTQSALLNAPKGGVASTANKPASSNNSSSTSGGASSSTSVKVTAAEKKLLTLYRKANAETKKAAVKLLETGANGSIVGDLLGGALGVINGKK